MKKDPTDPPSADASPPERMTDRGAATDLARFHAGDREEIARVYRQHVARVERAVSRYLRGSDAECVVHDLFVALLEREDLRRQFGGGEIGAWLATIAAHRAIDRVRQRRRFTLFDDPSSLDGALEPVEEEESLLDRDQRRQIRAALARFAELELPRIDRDGGLGELLRLRFEEGRTQVEAAAALGLPRTTLIEREQRLMRHLARFFRRQIAGGR